MAAPALNRRAGSVSSIGSSPTATPNSSINNNRVIPCYPELDFRSGSRIEELNRLIQEFSKHDQREYDDQRALEIHTAKDFIFSMLGKEPRRLVLMTVFFLNKTLSYKWMHNPMKIHRAPLCRFLCVYNMRVLICAVGFSDMSQNHCHEIKLFARSRPACDLLLNVIRCNFNETMNLSIP